MSRNLKRFLMIMLIAIMSLSMGLFLGGCSEGCKQCLGAVDKVYQELEITPMPDNAKELSTPFKPFTLKNETTGTARYTSSNEEIATIDSDGKVTPKALGTVTFTVTADGTDSSGKYITKSEVKTVEIVNEIVVTITLDKTTLALNAGQTYKLNATVTSGDIIVPSPELTWTTGKATVATVDEQGIVMALSQGTAKITVKYKQGSKTKSAQCMVTVTGSITPEDATVRAKNTDVVLSVGQTLDEPFIFTNIGTKVPTYSTSAANVAEVVNGSIVARGVGNAVVSASVGNASATINVSVVEGPSVTPKEQSITILKGQTYNAPFTFANQGSLVPTYSSSNTNVAIVENGNVKAVNVGTAIVTATLGNAQASITVTVIEATTVTAIESEIELEIGRTAEELFEFTNLGTSEVIYSSEDEEIAICEDNIITALGSGQTVITASVGGASAMITVNVKTPKITVIEPELEMEVGEEEELSSIFSFKYKGTLKPKYVSDDEDVIAIEGNVIVATGAGEAIIKCTLGKVKKTIIVTVSDPTPTIQIIPNMINMSAGTSQTITPIVTNYDGVISWSSSNESVVTVSNGVLNAMAPGSATIYAQAGPVSAVCFVTVTSSLTISDATASLLVTETKQLSVNGASGNVTWTTSNAGIATVTNDGLVTGVGDGHATITADDGYEQVTCEVTVTAPLALDVTELVLIKGDKVTINANKANVTWTTSNRNVANVSTAGLVTARNVGEAIITATVGSETATCTVTVKEAMEIDPETARLSVGSTLELLIENVYGTATWMTSDASVATVSQEGVVTGVGVGTVTITASTVNGESVSCEITVKLAMVITPASANMVVGDTLELTVANATGTVYWSSSSSAVASISNGVVTARGAGNVTITAMSDGEEATCVIAVKEPMTIDKQSAKGIVGTPFVLTVANADGTVTWSSSDTTVATVANGTVTFKTAGNVTITASTANGESVSCVFTVKLPLTITPAEPFMVVGNSLTLTVTNNETFCIWNVADSTIVTVSNGVLNALKAGTTTVSVTSGDEVAEVTVYVKNAMTMNKGELSLGSGLSETLSVINAEGTVTWSSSDTTIATVNANGKVTTIRVGTATITASTPNGETATCALTVTTDIALSEEERTVEVGTIFTLTVSGNKGTVIWESTNSAVATVSNGTVTAIAPGLTEITVTDTDGGVATCVLTVEPKKVKVTLNEEFVTIEEEQTFIIVATVENTSEPLEWAIDDSAIATVEDNGDNTATITAVKEGVTNVTVRVEGVSAVCGINVTAKPKPLDPPVMTLNYTEKSIDVHGGFKLRATVENTDEPATFSSSDTTVATVTYEDNVGTVRGAGVGTVTITVTCGELVQTCVVTVEDTGVAPICTMSLETITLSVGQQLDLYAIVTYGGLEVEELDKFNWTFSDESATNVVSVAPSTDGKCATVKGLKAGNTVIEFSYEASGIPDLATVPVVVMAADTELTLTGNGLVKTGDKYTLELCTALNQPTPHSTKLTMTVTEGGIPVVNPEITWESSRPTIVSVDSEGNIVGLTSGEAIITVTYQGFSLTINVTVTKPSTEILISGTAELERFTPVAFALSSEVAGTVTEVRIRSTSVGFAYDPITRLITISSRDGTGVGDLGNEVYVYYETELGTYKQRAIVYSKIIRTLKDLQDMATYAALEAGTEKNAQGIWSGYFVLGNDIYANGDVKGFGGYIDFSEREIAASFMDCTNCGFNGVFDGRGHNIDSLRIGSEWEGSNWNVYGAQAFIALLNKDGIIRNVSFTSGNVCYGSSFLVNIGAGTIEDVYIQMAHISSGNHNNNDYSGVICGRDCRYPLVLRRVFVEVPRIQSTTTNAKTYALGAVHEGYGMYQDVVVVSEMEPYRILSTGTGTNNVVSRLYSREEAATRNLNFSGWVASNSFWSIATDGAVVPTNIKNNFYNSTIYVSIVDFVDDYYQVELPFEVTANAKFNSIAWEMPAGATVVLAEGQTKSNIVKFKGQNDFKGRIGRTPLSVYDEGKIYNTYMYVATKVIRTRDDLDQFPTIAKAQHTEGYLWGGTFVLANDIQYGWGNYGWEGANGYKGFPMFGYYSQMAALRTAGDWDSRAADWKDNRYLGFDGVFDGNGHNIEGLFIGASYGGAAGAFISILHKDGVIKNLSFTHAYESGYVGFLTVSSGGRIHDIYIHADYQGPGNQFDRTGFIVSSNFVLNVGTTSSPIYEYAGIVERTFVAVDHLPSDKTDGYGSNDPIYTQLLGEWYDGAQSSRYSYDYDGASGASNDTKYDYLQSSGGYGNVNSTYNSSSSYAHAGVRWLGSGNGPTTNRHWIHCAAREQRSYIAQFDQWLLNSYLVNQTFWKLHTDGVITTKTLNGTDL